MKLKKEKKIIVAIDGYSSTGKSTIAKELARKLKYLYVDTGAMYRAITLYAMRQGYVDKEFLNKEALVNDLKNVVLSFKFNERLKYGEIYLNGKKVEKEIRKMEVSKLVSKVSTILEVRTKLVEQQRKMGLNKGLVMDGRDIGTVVFPEAELKLFMTASPEKRAQRRYTELLNKGLKVTYAEVLENVQERDRIDSTRTNSPLKKAEDAIEFDNSNMGLKEQYKRVFNIASQRIDSL